MTRQRKKYSKEFKLETIRMYENGERSASEIERELGITNGLLGKWKQELNRQPKKEEAFPGNGRLTDTEARIRQLERENLLLRQDKDILKKVLTMYSKDGK
jgi:transposase